MEIEKLIRFTYNIFDYKFCIEFTAFDWQILVLA